MKEKILIIDDDQAIRSLLELGLQKKGYKTALAAHGKEGIEKAIKEKFDVVLCDIKMNGVDGISVLEKVKEKDPLIEVIMITGYSSMESSIECMRKGAGDYITKPFNLNDLSIRIEKALEKRRLKEELALNEVTKIILSTIELDELLNISVSLTMKNLNSDDISIMQVDEKGKLYITYSTSLSEKIRNETRIAVGDRISGFVAEHKEPVLIIDGLKDDPRFKGIKGREDIKSSIVIPLLNDNKELIGIFNINRISINEIFDENDMNKAKIITSCITKAIKNANIHYQTKQKSEQELSRAYDELKRAYNKIKQTQEALIKEEKFSLMSKLASSLIHQLRTPLSTIELSSKFLQKEVHGTEKVDSSLKTIERNISRARNILEDMFDMILVKDKAMKIEKFKIDEILESVIESIKPKLESIGIEIRKDFASDDLKNVEGNKRYLEHVFINIISNSIDAMPDGGNLNIKLKRESKDKQVVVEITDSGSGIKEENMKELFSPFFTTKEKGVGLGLFAVKQILEAHKGDIEIKSRLNNGTSVTIVLPSLE